MVVVERSIVIRVVQLLIAGAALMLLIDCGHNEGRGPSSVSAKIRNGELAEGTYPYVGLYVSTRPDSTHRRCTGTLVGPHTVMTAAQCVDFNEDTPGQIVYGSELGTLANVTKVTLHPEHTSFLPKLNLEPEFKRIQSTVGVDLAMLKLDRNLSGPYGKLANMDAQPNSEILVIGFGENGQMEPGGSPVSGDKRSGTLHIDRWLSVLVPNYNGTPTSHLSRANGSFVFGINGTDQITCNEDQGAPGILNVEGQDLLYTMALNSNGSCNEATEAAHLNLNTYGIWIYTHLNLTNGSPPNPTRFARVMFADLLNRLASDPELKKIADKIKQGTTRQTIALQNLQSPAFRSRVITEVFRRMLDRDPTSREMTIWLDKMRLNNKTEDDAIIELSGGTAYFNRAQALGDANPNVNYLKTLFSDLLGRGLSAEALSAYLKLIQSGTPRNEVTKRLLKGNEYRQALITHYFRRYLRRKPTTTQLNNWVAKMNTTNRESVRAQLIGSDEYYKLAF